METRNIRKESPLIVIVGPTASGKTKLAVDLGREFDGEIICADSRTVYKDMDIGTAKPTKLEQGGIPHWGLDLIEPGERFTVADFKKYAEEKIQDIRSRGHTPFLVGGTGLYVDAILFNYQFGPESSSALRNELEGMSLERLHQYCHNNNVTMPENKYNKRYVIRAIEQDGVNTKRQSKPIDASIIVGITTDRNVLRDRIEARAEQIFDDGVVEEATSLGKKYGWDNEAMTGNVYPLVRLYQEGKLTREELKTKFTTLDWRLAKRQLTWLRRNPHIHWGNLEEVHMYVSRLLASE
jgi:tRNA dimethylallyltransferase